MIRPNQRLCSKNGCFKHRQAAQASAGFIPRSLTKTQAHNAFLTMTTLPVDAKRPITTQKLSINPDEVREAIELEHAISFREALSLYPKAIGWSFYFSLGVIMLGKIHAILHVIWSILNV
jgi:hypothetical protein